MCTYIREDVRFRNFIMNIRIKVFVLGVGSDGSDGSDGSTGMLASEF